jgi:ketosteroid isomerase-like protein
MDAFQTWEVVRDAASGKALINKYVVDSFTEMPDSDGGLGVDPRDVLIAYYRSANAGDWQTWLTLFQEDVVIDEQLAGHVEGLDILRGAIGGMEKGYSRFQNVPKHMVCQGNMAAVVSHISAANAAGEPIEAEVTNYFELRDGKIAYMANFHDTRPFDPFVSRTEEQEYDFIVVGTSSRRVACRPALRDLGRRRLALGPAASHAREREERAPLLHVRLRSTGGPGVPQRARGRRDLRAARGVRAGRATSTS